MKEIYQQTVEEVLERVNGKKSGLTSEQVKRSREKCGWNELTEGKKKGILQIFFEQYKDFLVLILIASAIISGMLGDVESAAVIVTVITINAILGTIQTVKAEQSLQSLKNLSGPEAKVLRDGTVVQIPARELVVGDVILLEAGDMIPADGRLIENASLKIDESALTGESLAVEKNMDTILTEAPLGDRTNMLFSGSFVTYGRGKAVVTDIGMQTEVGKIAGLLKSTSEKQTPLQVSLEVFGKKLSIMILVFCGLLFAINVFRGEKISSAFMFAVALAVAAIPEALSSIVTIVLSFGTQKMAKEHAIIRKLQAVEGLGSVSIICSDKTGTLTQNKMTVEDYYIDGKRISAEAIDISDQAQKCLLNYSILCNDSTNENGVEIGDPTETALINLGSRYGIEAASVRKLYPRNGELPFDSDRKMMSTLHLIDGKNQMIVKGAVDKLLERTEQIWTKEGIRKITEEDKEKIQRQNQEFSMEGLRVLAFTYREIPKNHTLTIQDEDHLVFLGLIAMMDPPREESKAAVAECIKAGIRPVMITGDHKITAAAIAKRVGILHDLSEACEGADIENMSDEELKEFVSNISVYARVSPEHKIRIVRAWQERGMIVAMTGDGVNDRGLSRKHIMENCDQSLRNMQLDYLDLYYCHRYDENTDLEETLRAMSDLVAQGKVLYYGVSEEWGSARIEKAQKIIEKLGLYPISVIQPQYNMVDRYIEHEIMGTCRKYGIGITSFSPLAQGLLTGKYKKGQPYPKGSRATHQADRQINDLLTDENLAIVDELTKVADDLGTSNPVDGMDFTASGNKLCDCRCE